MSVCLLMTHKCSHYFASFRVRGHLAVSWSCRCNPGSLWLLCPDLADGLRVQAIRGSTHTCCTYLPNGKSYKDWTLKQQHTLTSAHIKCHCTIPSAVVSQTHRHTHSQEQLPLLGPNWACAVKTKSFELIPLWPRPEWTSINIPPPVT